MDKKTKQALRRRMLRIDATMASTSMLRGADRPEAVAEWGRAQDAMGAAERAIEAGDEMVASMAMDCAQNAMRRHAAILRSVLASGADE